MQQEKEAVRIISWTDKSRPARRAADANFAPFLIYGILQFASARYAWFIGIIAVVASQILVVLFWKDANFGTIPNLIVLLVFLVSFGYFLLHSEFSGRVKTEGTGFQGGICWRNALQTR